MRAEFNSSLRERSRIYLMGGVQTACACVRIANIAFAHRAVYSAVCSPCLCPEAFAITLKF